jgi:hypothetical protein
MFKEPAYQAARLSEVGIITISEVDPGYFGECHGTWSEFRF